MARPARKLAPEPNIEGDEADNAQPLDEASQQEHRTGQVAQGDEFIQTLARRAGWTPKEEWKRDPTRWVDERTYLEHLPDELDSLKERNKRTAQAAEQAIEDSKRRAREEALSDLRKAAADSDEEAAERAAKRLAENSGPPPQTQAWLSQNAWFNSDPRAQALAVAEINRLAATGASIEDQLAGAEEEARKRFPEHFGKAERREEPTEVRLSERRPAPPAINPGTRGAGSAPKERGFADIPPGDRALYAKHFSRNFESTGLKPDEAQAKYARSYWANKGENA